MVSMTKVPVRPLSRPAASTSFHPGRSLPKSQRGRLAFSKRMLQETGLSITRSCYIRAIRISMTCFFYEYFEGGSSKGIGASHQTDWSALMAEWFDWLEAKELVAGEAAKSEASSRIQCKQLQSGRKQCPFFVRVNPGMG